jgi:cardiolipin synthase (CMP-forming)
MRLFELGAGDEPIPVTTRVLTVPNVVSLARILALPFVYLDLVTGRLARALVLMVVVSATDWLDGYLARRLRQVSRLGQLLDPVADRLLFVAVGVGVIVGGLVPWWVVAVILVRDVAVLVVGAALLARGAQPPPVSRTGKLATFGLMAAFPLLVSAALLGGGAATPEPVVHAIGWSVLVAGVVLYWIAGIGYARDVRAQSARPEREDDARSRA